MTRKSFCGLSMVQAISRLGAVSIVLNRNLFGTPGKDEVPAPRRLNGICPVCGHRAEPFVVTSVVTSTEVDGERVVYTQVPGIPLSHDPTVRIRTYPSTVRGGVVRISHITDCENCNNAFWQDAELMGA